MAEKFEGRYQVADGYAGGARPQYVRISADELEDDMTDEELVEYYESVIQDHYEQNISPDAERVDDFVAWARKQLAKRST